MIKEKYLYWNMYLDYIFLVENQNLDSGVSSIVMISKSLNHFQSWKVIIQDYFIHAELFLIEKVKHKLWVASCMFRYTSSEYKSTSRELKARSYEFKFIENMVRNSNLRIRRLKARIARLKARVITLKTRLGRLKARVEVIKPRVK